MYFSYFLFRNLATICITNKKIFSIAINNKDWFYLKSIMLIIVLILLEYIISYILNYALINQKYIIFLINIE